MHLYEQALKDFVNLEHHCGQRCVILFHDAVPTGRADPEPYPRYAIHTGDVWKTVRRLKHYGPDLDVFALWNCSMPAGSSTDEF